METKHTRRDFVRLSVATGAPLALGTGLGAGFGEASASQTEERSFFDVVRSRRSVREFRSTPVPEEHLRLILDAARLAPTSGNQQPWKFLVVRDPAVIGALRDACVERNVQFRESRGMTVTEEVRETIRGSLQGYFSAPVYVAVLTDNESRYPTYNHWDGPLAAGYLMLAARALGYGTVFITDSVPPDVTKEVLNIPDRYTRVCFTPIGVPVAWPESPEKKALEEFLVYEGF